MSLHVLNRRKDNLNLNKPFTNAIMMTSMIDKEDKDRRSGGFYVADGALSCQCDK